LLLADYKGEILSSILLLAFGDTVSYKMGGWSGERRDVRPNELLHWTAMRWARDRLGPNRAATSYAWAAFLNKGVTLAFGTDYPVEPVTPFRGLYAAVTRKSENGKQEYFPEQKLTMDQAIAAYTTGAAFAEFEEKEKGKLVPGMLADFVVLDQDVTLGG